VKKTYVVCAVGTQHVKGEKNTFPRRYRTAVDSMGGLSKVQINYNFFDSTIIEIRDTDFPQF